MSTLWPKKEIERVTSIVIREAAWVFFLAWVGVKFVWLVMSPLFPFNATDDAQNRKRAGVVIVTDYETGCEYLRTRTGGLSPRMAAGGIQMGCHS